MQGYVVPPRGPGLLLPHQGLIAAPRGVMHTYGAPPQAASYQAGTMRASYPAPSQAPRRDHSHPIVPGSTVIIRAQGYDGVVGTVHSKQTDGNWVVHTPKGNLACPESVIEEQFPQEHLLPQQSARNHEADSRQQWFGNRQQHPSAALLPPHEPLGQSPAQSPGYPFGTGTPVKSSSQLAMLNSPFKIDQSTKPANMVSPSFSPAQSPKKLQLSKPQLSVISREPGLYALKWILPMFWAAFGFYVQSVCLHYATYQYVHHMLHLTPEQRNNSTYAALEDPISEALGGNTDGQDFSGFMSKLDMLAAVFPGLFGLISFGDLARRLYGIHLGKKEDRYPDDVDGGYFEWPVRTLQVWSKVMLCAGLLFIMKGILGAVTTVPDSNGWPTCESRLKADGLEWMEEAHTFWDMLSVDFVFNVGKHHSLRYCSDMMYSGHTFAVTLAALGVYENARIVLSFHNPQDLHADKQMLEAHGGGAASKGILKFFGLFKGDSTRFKQFKTGCLVFIGALALFEQSAEIYFVLKTHFHYTSDVFMAIVITFLLYSNGAVTLAAKWWIEWDRPQPTNTKQKTSEDEDLAQILQSRGDIFVPPCCFPFCCLSGREHIYDDNGICKILEKLEQGEKYKQIARDLSGDPNLDPDKYYEAISPSSQAVRQQRMNLRGRIKHELNLGEGVSWKEMISLAQGREVQGREPSASTPSASAESGLQAQLLVV